MNLRHIKDINVKGKRVLLRVDLNFDPNTSLSIHHKLKKILPTIKFLQKKGAIIVLSSHRGRPVGFQARELSLSVFSQLLVDQLGMPVSFVQDLETYSSHQFSNSEIILLENLRFFPGEEVNDSKFAHMLSKWGDLYVNDAFGVTHRKNASLHAITQYLPSFAGFLIHEELVTIDRFFNHPKRPFLAIIGGKKTADKIPVLKRLLKVVDQIYLGGVVGNTFLVSMGITMSQINYDPKLLEDAKFITSLAKKQNVKIYLPQDIVVQSKPALTVPVHALTKDMHAVDIGLLSQKKLAELINKAKTILWNGPMGKYEETPFEKGTLVILKGLRKTKAEVLIGGGDTLSTFDQNIFHQSNIYFSTGGGALLYYLAYG